MFRSILASAISLSLAVPAFAQEMDPTKTMCGDMILKGSESMLKHGETLQKAARVAQMLAKAMRKSSSVEARIQAVTAEGMMRSGKDMERTGKRMKALAEQLKESGKDHSLADHMAEVAKIPEKFRAKIAELGKASAGEMKRAPGPASSVLRRAPS